MIASLVQGLGLPRQVPGAHPGTTGPRPGSGSGRRSARAVLEPRRPPVRAHADRLVGMDLDEAHILSPAPRPLARDVDADDPALLPLPDPRPGLARRRERL